MISIGDRFQCNYKEPKQGKRGGIERDAHGRPILAEIGYTIEVWGIQDFGGVPYVRYLAVDRAQFGAEYTTGPNGTVSVAEAEQHIERGEWKPTK